MEAFEKKGPHFGKISLGASVSSLIDLKAELLRKREDLKVQRLKQPSQKQVFIKQKLNIANETPVNEKERLKRPPVPKDFPEEDADLQKSRAALERKAKLYDKLSSGKLIPDEEESEQYMVNFQRKAVDTAIEAREKEEADDIPTVLTREEAAKNESEYREIDKSLTGTDEEWVDYTDALGRSRRCMRKDLPSLIHNDKELTGKTGTVETDAPERTAQFLSYEATKDKLRQKWEEKEAENALKESIHYGDIRFEEAREHGVGFYDLSGDAAERQKQLDLLNKLRDQTEKQKEISNRMKEKRKAMLETRLARIRQKKNIAPEAEENKAGSSDAEDSDEEKKADAVLVPPGELRSHDEGPVPEVPKTRPWDEGKNLAEIVNEPQFLRKKKFSQRDWVDLQRQDRPSEFAPPSAYSTDQKKAKYSNFTQGRTEDRKSVV